MAYRYTDEHATRVSVHLVRGQGEAARALDRSKVAWGPVTLPEGELYAGGELSGTETTPEWWEAFIGPEVLDNTPECRRFSSAALLTRVGGALFAVTVGDGKGLLAPGALSSHFGSRILSSLAGANNCSLKPVTGQVRQLATLADRPVRELKPWVIADYELEVVTDNVRQVTALPSRGFTDLFGPKIQGDAGLTFTTSAGKKGLVGMIQRLHEAHEVLFRADPDFDGAVSRKTLMGIISLSIVNPAYVVANRDVAPPDRPDILLPLLQQVAQEQEANPAQLYHPIAKKLHSTVMLTVAGQENHRKKAFKERVRRSLRVLEHAGLLDCQAVGHYTITAKGKRLAKDGVVFDQELLNELHYEKWQEEHARKKLADSPA